MNATRSRLKAAVRDLGAEVAAVKLDRGQQRQKAAFERHFRAIPCAVDDTRAPSWWPRIAARASK